MEKQYFIGLDMGTNSVGWAVTDTKYHLLKAKGKDLWGVREFESAKGTIDTRTHRTARRAHRREVARRGFVKLFFREAIENIDKNFFIRIEESKYHLEDKKINAKYTLFNDHSYTDQQYFKEYPTIFHLRKELIENPEPHDVRLVYLAVSNMFQHRGHFLNKGLSAEGKETSIQTLFMQLLEAVRSMDETLAFEDISDFDIIESICLDKNLSKTQMTEKLAEKLHISRTKNKPEYEILKAISGQKFKPYLFLPAIKNDDEWKNTSFSFRNEIEEFLSNLANTVSQEEMDFMDVLKSLHDAICLSEIMRGHQYLSFARVESYEKHKYDLKILKAVIKKYCQEAYDDMFRIMQKGNYSAYVNSVNSDDKQRRNVDGRNKEELYGTIKKLLSDVPECEEKQYIMNEMEKGDFLPKQLTSENGVIPNQVHFAELKAILHHAETYLPFLLEKDENDLTVSERILQLFAFQIPYYVGPLKKSETNNAWVVRKQEGQVYPWNFDKMIDLKQTSAAFIENLVGKCTYLSDEKVVPKNSLLYEKFQVLNELNNLKINGVKISVELKQNIYQDLFQKGKKVTRKALEKYCIGKGVIGKGEETLISGIDGDFKNYLSSYGKFFAVFGNDMKNDGIQNMVEDIIFWSTVYGDDKKFLEEMLAENYGDILTEQDIHRIKGFKCKDWGNLSREFLEMGGCQRSDGEILPLIDMMWETNCNLMELLGEQYTYLDTLKQRSNEIKKSISELEYADLDGMYLSAPVKRMIWQTVLVLREVIKVMGCPPQKLFIEMAREEKEKEPTISRKKKLLEIYKKLKKDDTVKELIQSLESMEEKDLRQRQLYLYYMQKGRCMYTGEVIDIHELMYGNTYDIDHIYPRHFVKDDSIIHNLVLVKKTSNAYKSDKYPILDAVYEKQKGFWTELHQQGLISDEKYKRLIGRNPFTDEQLAGFINRQLVETRQSTKALAKIMDMAFVNTKIVYVKAGLVSDFRQKFKLLKSRAVNDFHHAQDAYLNIVVGNVYHVKFTANPYYFIKEYRKKPQENHYHMDRMFEFDVKRGNETAWIISKGDDSTIATVKNMMDKNSPIMTRMNFEAHGALYNATVYGKNKAKQENYISLKSSDARMADVTKYGGYTSVSNAYFFLVEHEDKGKRVRTIEGLPIYLKDNIGNDKEKLEAYCMQSLGMKNPDIRLLKIKMQSLMKKDGYYMYLTGKTGNRLSTRNAVSLCLKREWQNYIKKIENVQQKGFMDKAITKEQNMALYNILTNKMKNSIFAKRPNFVGDKLEAAREKFENLSSEEQCKIILEILQLTALAPTKADLRAIGESANTGVMQINKKITDAKEFLLIHQSPAGLYETEVDLLTV